jgi:PAS domain S-box-containing protein
MDIEKIRVLYIEDSKVDQLIFRHFVSTKELPYELTITSSVAESKNLLSTQIFDIIISDYWLSDGTAFDILHLASQIPVIMVTGEHDVDVAIKALKSGIFDYVIKDAKSQYLDIIPEKVSNAILSRQFIEHRKDSEERIRFSEKKHRALLQSIQSPVLALNKNFEIVYCNEPYSLLVGLSVEELEGRKLLELFPTFVRTKSFQAFLEVLKTNQIQTVEGKLGNNYLYTRIFPTEFGLLSIADNVTERKKEENLLKLQYKLSFHLSTTDDLETTLQYLCEFFLLIDDIDFNYIYACHHSTKKFSKQYSKVNPNELSKASLAEFENILEQSLFYTTDSGFFSCENHTENYPELLSRSFCKSIIYLPIMVENQALFLIVLGSCSFASFSEHTKRVLEITKSQIENVVQRLTAEEKVKSLYQSLKDDIELASSVQNFLIPSWVKYERNLLCSSIYKPSSSIGGDLFDIHELTKSKYLIYVADISGHGVKSALLMTAVKSIMNMLIESKTEEIEPYNLVNRLNRIVCNHLFKDDYMTILAGLIDLEKETITYLNAGHPPILAVNTHTGTHYFLDEKGSIPIGWSSDIEYTEQEQDVIKLHENEIYLFYTDGIFECENETYGQLGIDGFTNLIKAQIDGSNPITIPYKFKKTLDKQHYDTGADDFTLAIVEKLKFCNKENETEKFFRFYSLLNNSGCVGDECEKMVREYFHDTVFSAKVEIVINEILNNIIEHGLEMNSDSYIAFEIELIKNGVWLRFWDKGILWELPDFSENDDIVTIDKTRGMGLQTIFQIASKVNLNRYDDLNETLIFIDFSKKR